MSHAHVAAAMVGVEAIASTIVDTDAVTIEDTEEVATVTATTTGDMVAAMTTVHHVIAIATITETDAAAADMAAAVATATAHHVDHQVATTLLMLHPLAVTMTGAAIRRAACAARYCARV